MDELMIDETLVHDIDEQFDDMTRKNNIEHKIRNRKPRRRVSVSASGAGAKLGAAGTRSARADERSASIVARLIALELPRARPRAGSHRR